MSGLVNALDNLIGKRSGELLSVLRIVSAYMYTLHGTNKMFGYPTESGEFILMTLLPGLIGVLEVFGGPRPGKQIVDVLAQISLYPFPHRRLEPMFAALGNILKALADKLAQQTLGIIATDFKMQRHCRQEL